MNKLLPLLLLFALPGIASAQLGNAPNMTKVVLADTDLLYLWDISGTAVRVVRVDSAWADVFRAISGDATATAAGVVTVDDVQSATSNTEAADNSTTQVATTAYVQQEINGAGGTNLSCSSGQCNVDDVFVLTAGDVMTGVLTLPLGSAGAPSLAFPNANGIFSVSSPGQVGISVAGNNEVSILGNRLQLNSGANLHFKDDDDTHSFQLVSPSDFTSNRVCTIEDDATPLDGCVHTATVVTAGRSLTKTGDDIAADPELFTRIPTIVIVSPADYTNGHVQTKFSLPVTLSRISCSTDVGTVTIQFDERAEATPNSGGTDVMTSTLVCDSNTEATTSFANAAIAADVPFNLDIDATASSPTVVRIHIDLTYDE